MEKMDSEINIKNGIVFLNGKDIGELEVDDSVDGHYLLLEDVSELKGIKILDIFDDRISCIRIHFQNSFYHRWNSIFTYFTSINFTRNEISYVNLHLSTENWDFKYGIHSFLKKLTRSLNDSDLVYIHEEQFDDFEDIIQLGLNIYLTSDVWRIDILIVHNEIIELLNSKIENIFLELSNENNLDLINTFTFPPEIQSSCEQYLIYFATFLKDIGINAETNIESKAHETLFTVIPEDGEEALDKIREALNMYLSLPQNPEFDAVVAEFTDMGVQQLASQVYFLRSQLVMANATLQMKDATIKSLQLTNYQQKTIIDSQQAEEKNEEEIAGGLAKVKEVDLKIISFNLPELLRRIKRKFQ
ncbi:MAG: hypothetical protein AAF617_07015 [Bacteroidota bacterium]